MTSQFDAIPEGARPTSGVVHRRSAFSVAETVERLTRAIEAAGAKVFVTVDHSSEAERAGLTLRNTKLVIFGNPAAGTPVMAAAPLAALDLPLKVLVWEDDDRAVWLSYVDAGWLADRHGLDARLAAPLSATEPLTGRAATV